jgi:hypothetical protein
MSRVLPIVLVTAMLSACAGDRAAVTSGGAATGQEPHVAAQVETDAERELSEDTFHVAGTPSVAAERIADAFTQMGFRGYDGNRTFSPVKPLAADILHGRVQAITGNDSRIVVVASARDERQTAVTVTTELPQHERDIVLRRLREALAADAAPRK